MMPARIIPGLLVVLLVMGNWTAATPMNGNDGVHDPTHDLVSGPSGAVTPDSPGTSSRSWSSSLSPPRRPLDATDHEILQALSADLTARASKKRGHGKTQLMDRETKRLSRLTSARRTSGWPEPLALSRLDEVPPFRHLVGKGELAYSSDAGVRDRIVGLFAGRLRWVYIGEMPPRLDSRAYHKRSPYFSRSRVLPLPPTGKEPTHVHMTQHNVPIRKGGALVGSVLEGKPYYAFWGVADKEVRDKVPVTFYGAGWLDGEHVSEVDAHLGPLLENIRRGMARR